MLYGNLQIYPSFLFAALRPPLPALYPTRHVLLRVLDTAEYSAFESTLNSSIASYRTPIYNHHTIILYRATI